jgi:hypothetical protein
MTLEEMAEKIARELRVYTMHPKPSHKEYIGRPTSEELGKAYAVMSVITEWLEREAEYERNHPTNLHPLMHAETIQRLVLVTKGEQQ